MANLAADLDDRFRALEKDLEQLARDRQGYVDLFDLAPDATLVTDPAGHIADANQAAAALLGQDLRGKSLDLLVPMEARGLFRAKVIALVTAGLGRASWQGGLRLRAGDVAVHFTVGAVRHGLGPLRLLWTLRPAGAIDAPLWPDAVQD
jgi:PAS domain S-box-containing protein